MVLLSLPLAPVVVEKTTTPDVADASADCSIVNLTVLLDASLMNWIAGPEVPLVLTMVRSLTDPAPPWRPSMVQKLPPFILNMAVALEALIVFAPAPAASLMVILFIALAHGTAPNTIGNVSPAPGYEAFNSSMTGPVKPPATRAAMAFVKLV